MTHEPKPRTDGPAAGPEHDHTLPDAASIPVHRTFAELAEAEAQKRGDA